MSNLLAVRLLTLEEARSIAEERKSLFVAGLGEYKDVDVIKSLVFTLDYLSTGLANREIEAYAPYITVSKADGAWYEVCEVRRNGSATYYEEIARCETFDHARAVAFALNEKRKENNA